jgi:hypothetical protein
MIDRITEQPFCQTRVSGSNGELNRYVKVKGHPNWFLVLDANQKEPQGLGCIMKEKILRTEVYTLHVGKKVDTTDCERRVTMAATKKIDYESLAKKYGTILIRPIGSFMPLYYNEITEETFDTDFPIEEFAEIVICENDQKAEYKWVEYLKSRFPNKKILTINFFDLRSENEVEKYFSKAKYITFSTTFSRYQWFEKLTKFSNGKKIIGYCHSPENWERANEINPNVEIVSSM